MGPKKKKKKKKEKKKKNSRWSYTPFSHAWHSKTGTYSSGLHGLQFKMQNVKYGISFIFRVKSRGGKETSLLQPPFRIDASAGSGSPPL